MFLEEYHRQKMSPEEGCLSNSPIVEIWQIKARGWGPQPQTIYWCSPIYTDFCVHCVWILARQGQNFLFFMITKPPKCIAVYTNTCTALGPACNCMCYMINLFKSLSDSFFQFHNEMTWPERKYFSDNTLVMYIPAMSHSCNLMSVSASQLITFKAKSTPICKRDRKHKVILKRVKLSRVGGRLVCTHRPFAICCSVAESALWD